MSQNSAGTPGLQGLPVDLVGIALIGIWLLAEPFIGFGGDAQIVLGLVAVFVAPGYALVAALFPVKGSQNFEYGWLNSEGSQQVGTVAPNLVERLLLSIGMSVCLVPFIGLGLNYAGWPIQRGNVLLVLGSLTLLLTAAAAVRRWSAPPSRRFSLVTRPEFVETWGRNDRRSSRSSVALSVVLVGVLLLATTGLGVAVWQPTQSQSEQFTEFYLQTRDADTGEFVAGEYPDDVSASDSDPVYVGITNHEGERVEYTIVSKLQQFAVEGDRRAMVSESEIDRVSVELAPGETRRFQHDVTRDVSGEHVRLTYLLYVGEPPADPDVDNGYRHIHLWIGQGPSE